MMPDSHVLAARFMGGMIGGALAVIVLWLAGGGCP